MRANGINDRQTFIFAKASAVFTDKPDPDVLRSVRLKPYHTPVPYHDAALTCFSAFPDAFEKTKQKSHGYMQRYLSVTISCFF